MPQTETSAKALESPGQLTDAEIAANRTRLQIRQAVYDFHADILHLVTGQFPAFYRELPILHDSDTYPILSSVPMIVAYHPDIDPREFRELSVVKRPHQRFLTCKRSENEFSYLHLRDVIETTFIFTTNDGVEVPISDAQAALARQQQYGDVDMQHTLGVFYYPTHHPAFGTQLDARVFPIAFPIRDIVGFDSHRRLWTPQRLEAQRDAVLREEQIFSPIAINTEDTAQALRVWHREPQVTFSFINEKLKSNHDWLEFATTEITPLREISWGDEQQIQGFAHRIAYWDGQKPVTTELQFSIKGMSAGALRSLHLQAPREQNDRTNVHLSLNILGDTILMKIDDQVVKNPNEQDFWIRVLSSMSVQKERFQK